MELYLVRHGDALSAAEDPQRPLSSGGRRRVEQTARLAVQRKLRVVWIYHSGIRRAQETAEILAAHIVPEAGLAPLAGLLPEDDPAAIEAKFRDATEPVILVAHLPFLERLAALLIHGDCERPAAEFSPATMVCFSRHGAQWKISWRIAL